MPPNPALPQASSSGASHWQRFGAALDVGKLDLARRYAKGLCTALASQLADPDVAAAWADLQAHLVAGHLAAASTDHAVLTALLDINDAPTSAPSVILPPSPDFTSARPEVFAARAPSSPGSG